MEIENDFCRLDGRRHFVRGLIEIPIQNLETYFGYGVWIEVDEADWWRLSETWNEPEQGEVFRGSLANELDTHPGSMNLQVSLETREQLPAVRIIEEHRLASEQRNGISNPRADELASSLAH